MTRIPAWFKNFTRNGPYHLNCKKCGKRVSSNALARAAHERGCPGVRDNRR